MVDENPFQSIDALLEYLYSIKNEAPKGVSELHKLASAKKIDVEDLRSMINKLEIDKNVDSSYFQNNPQYDKIYRISFQGRYFIKAGGYTQQEINNNAEKTRLDKIESVQRNFRYTQNVLLILVAVGGLVAAWYYLIEIGKHYYWWK